MEEPRYTPEYLAEVRRRMRTMFRQVVADVGRQMGQEYCQRTVASDAWRDGRFHHNAPKFAGELMTIFPAWPEEAREAISLFLCWAIDAVASGQPDAYDVDIERAATGQWIPVLIVSTHQTEQE